MVKKNYVPIFRRRREGKTDYRKRRGIIVGEKEFLTVSISGKYVYGQIHRASSNGDFTICSATSLSLAKIAGWKGYSKNLPSAYLTGYLLGKRALAKNISNLVFYSGIDRFVHGSRIASLLNGAKEAGLNVMVDKKSLPDEKRKKGMQIEDYSRKVEDEDKNAFNRIFSSFVASGFDPKKYSTHFDESLRAIEKHAVT